MKIGCFHAARPTFCRTFVWQVLSMLVLQARNQLFVWGEIKVYESYLMVLFLFVMNTFKFILVPVIHLTICILRTAGGPFKDEYTFKLCFSDVYTKNKKLVVTTFFGGRSISLIPHLGSSLPYDFHCFAFVVLYASITISWHSDDK
jgi:hypothetical protein